MRSQRYQGKDIRRVLAGMITDKVVLSRVASQWTKAGLFDTAYANLVGSWCVDYYRKYEQAPNGQIQAIYERWAEGRQPDKATVEGINRLLAYISEEHSQSQPVNSEYLLDLAGSLFNRVRVKQAIREAEELLEANRPNEALSVLSGLNRVQLGTGSILDPRDFGLWEKAFDVNRYRNLVRYSGGLAGFFDGSMVRNSTIAFMGPDKSGKTWLLIDVAYRALRNRCNVAYFEVGDLSENEVVERLGQRAAKLPLHSGFVKVPVRWESKDSEPEYETRKLEGLTDFVAYRAFSKICRSRDSFRLSCHPSGTISIDDIHGMLLDWSASGWTADVVIIDYADILAPPSGYKDPLDQVDQTWSRLHKLDQTLHCLVVTATQSNAAAYNNKGGMLTRKHFSGRKTKLAHVTGMVGINIPENDEDGIGVYRLKWIVRRNAKAGPYVSVVGCIDIGCPTMMSYW